MSWAEGAKDRAKGPHPMSWMEFRAGTFDAWPGPDIPLADWPDAFVLAATMQKHIEELVAPRGPLREAWEQLQEARGKRGFEGEQDRIVYRDNGAIRIATHSIGESRPVFTGVHHTFMVGPNTIGVFHSHTVDSDASAIDILPLIMRRWLFVGLVTPRRSSMFFPSDQTPSLKVRDAAWGYLRAMGRANGRSLLSFTDTDDDFLTRLATIAGDTSITEGNWTTRTSDIEELKIVSYQTPRGNAVFTRRT